MPRSVICSPSHMMKAVPVVSEVMVRSRKPQPGLATTSAPEYPKEPPRPRPSSQVAMKKDWTSDRRTQP